MKKTNIEELIGMIKDTTITELTWSEGDSKITLKQGAPAGSVVVPVPVAAAPAAQAAVPAAAPAETPAAKPTGHEIKSPMVGTFYEAPGPDSPIFVKVGDTVKKGQVLCIIEAMKLMNEIESDKDGVIAEISVSNEAPVEYDTVLFRLS